MDRRRKAQIWTEIRHFRESAPAVRRRAGGDTLLDERRGALLCREIGENAAGVGVVVLRLDMGWRNLESGAEAGKRGLIILPCDIDETAIDEGIGVAWRTPQRLVGSTLGSADIAELQTDRAEPGGEMRIRGKPRHRRAQHLDGGLRVARQS